MSDPLVTVETFGNTVEAELAKNRLEVEGIAAFVMGAETTGMLWHVGSALGGVKLQVAEADLPRARRILAGRLDALDSSDIDDYGLDERPTASRAHTPHMEALEEDEDIPEPEKDIIARRAWRTAVIGVLLCPPLLTLMSLWLLLQLSAAPGQLSEAGKLRVVGAVVLNTLVLLGVLYFGLGMGALGYMRL